jgi:hypothetical protein
VAQSLARLGVKLMYGVIGIPVTELASAAQVHGQYACSRICHINTQKLT